MTTSNEHGTQSRFDLLDEFVEEGCPVCSLGLRRVAHYIDAINYDSVGDPGVRRQLRAALGFCNTHAHQWLRTAFVLGTAQIYQEVLGIVREEVATAPHALPALGQRLGALLGTHGPAEAAPVARPTGSCPVCLHLAETEEMLLSTLVRSLPNESFREAYLASPGLCLPHLRMALALAPPEEVATTMRERARRTEDVLLAQLAEIIRKHDYRYHDEPVGEERGAAARAVAHVAGGPGIAKSQIL